MKRVMALATRVECDEESDGFGGKSDGNEGGRRLTATRVMGTATVTTWAVVMVTRLMGNKEGKGEGGKGNRDGDSDNVGDGDGDDNDGKGNGDAIARPTPTTTFDIQGGRGQQLPLSRAPRVTLGGQRPSPCRAVP